jgi:hypothetical protein
MSVCVVGCGVAGTLVCLELIRAGIEPKEILVIDPYFDGGALGRKWGGIQSNTRWDQITEVMKDYTSAQKSIEKLSQTYKPEETVLLSDLNWLLEQSLRPYHAHMNVYIDICQSLQQTNSGWAIQLSNNILEAPTVILCQGGKEKLTDFGKPLLSLEIALDQVRLSRIIRPFQSVAVFGMAHSGTLVCKHLLALDCKVYGVHNTAIPFLYERDGHYDGIKRESAEIADRLINESPKRFELCSFQDTKKLFKILTKVDWIVSAIGFQTSPIQIKDTQGNIVSFQEYNSDTACLTNGLYGFGLAYPGVTQQGQKTYKDVSIPSFISQIRRCLPSILTKS